MSGYKFYFHYLGSTGCQLDVALPRALTLSLETVQQSTITIHPSWPQDLWVVLFFVLHSSFLPQSFTPYPFIPSFPSLAGVFSFPSLSYSLLDVSFPLPSIFPVYCVLFVFLLFALPSKWSPSYCPYSECVLLPCFVSSFPDHFFL